MTETPAYTVLQKQNKFELRQYPGMIQAEVQVAEKDYKSAAEEGFRILADYIFGNNISREKIDMTTPVHVASSQKIAMTTPVTITGGDTFTVAFIMPSAYTVDTLPIPRNRNIRFNVVPEQKMAAVGEEIESTQALLFKPIRPFSINPAQFRRQVFSHRKHNLIG